jgi:hypothetical protein
MITASVASPPPVGHCTIAFPIGHEDSRKRILVMFSGNDCGLVSTVSE